MDMPYIVKPDNTEAPYLPANGRAFSGEELQTAVGGYFEFVYLAHGGTLVVNEDGKWKELTFNPTASAFYRSKNPFGEVVGDVLVCNKEMLN